MDTAKNGAFEYDENSYGVKVQSIPKPEKNIGIDTNEVFFDNIVNAGLSSSLDITALESFSQVSQSRDQIYAMLDTMAKDSMVSAVLETYAEDATEYNDSGRIVWVESADSDVLKYITFLIDTIDVDKHIYKWVYNLCKYGDVYLKLYRESDSDDLLFAKEEEAEEQTQQNEAKQINEDVNIKVHSKNDRYTHYVEMIPNPAELFELTKFGKTYGYIKAPVKSPLKANDQFSNPYYKYKFNKSDINVYPATEFVHACLDDNSSRTPEEVSIFLEERTEDGKEKDLTYSVRRGQSLLYNVHKIWRELNLLENSVLLNRVTKSSIVRLINVEVGDMPKENVGPHLAGIKNLIEQKAAINESTGYSEYTNPGPVENNIYVPTRGGIGTLSTQQIGGDVDVKSLADLDYFKNKFFGSLRVPKQYFGDTDDGAGFNGGQSLSIISSRYAKMVKRIQHTILQAITDAINLMLLDKGLSNYVNKFDLHMLPPTTQEEIDRRNNLSSKIQITSDIMNTLDDVDEPIVKLKVLKSLLSSVVDDMEILQEIEAYIEELELQKTEQAEDTAEDEAGADGANDDDNFDFGGGPSSGGASDMDFGSDDGGLQSDLGGDLSASDDSDSESGGGETILPNPSDLDMDFTDNNLDI